MGKAMNIQNLFKNAPAPGGAEEDGTRLTKY